MSCRLTCLSIGLSLVPRCMPELTMTHVKLLREVGGWQADGSQAVSGSLIFKFDTCYLQSPTQTMCVCVNLKEMM